MVGGVTERAVHDLIYQAVCIILFKIVLYYYQIYEQLYKKIIGYKVIAINLRKKINTGILLFYLTGMIFMGFFEFW